MAKTTKRVKDERLEIRLSSAELKMFEKAASKTGESLSGWVRRQLLLSSRLQLGGG